MYGESRVISTIQGSGSIPVLQHKQRIDEHPLTMADARLLISIFPGQCSQQIIHHEVKQLADMVFGTAVQVFMPEQESGVQVGKAHLAVQWPRIGDGRMAAVS